MAACRYWELTLPAGSDVGEGVANLLWELGALGVVEEQTPPAPPRVRAFFADTADRHAVAACVRDYLAALRALGFPASGTPRVARLDDTDWVRAWREHFRPLPVGRRLLVVPPWDAAAPSDGRLPIVIEPGRAFGTGHHGSTAGCLEQLEHVVARDRPPEAIDVGTGSGILAIAAARLGVPRVRAVDVDPDAIANATANAALNGVTDRIHCVVGDASAVAGAVPLVLANLLSAAHTGLAARYGELVSPGGTLILGGILDPEAGAVADAMRGHGWSLRGRRSIDGWTTLELGPRTGGAALHDRA